MKEFINKNFIGLVAIVLLVLLYLQRCSGDGVATIPPPDTVTIVYHHYHDSTIITKPTLVNNIPPKKEDIPPVMLPDTNYYKLKAQYEALLVSNYTKNIHEDSIQLDTFGVAKVTDTVQNNTIIGRKWNYQLSIPEKITTITKYSAPKNQIYIGVGVLGNQFQPISGGKANILLKTKKDQIYHIGANIIPGIPLTYETGLMWKIRINSP